MRPHLYHDVLALSDPRKGLASLPGHLRKDHGETVAQTGYVIVFFPRIRPVCVSDLDAHLVVDHDPEFLDDRFRDPHVIGRVRFLIPARGAFQCFQRVRPYDPVRGVSFCFGVPRAGYQRLYARA